MRCSARACSKSLLWFVFCLALIRAHAQAPKRPITLAYQVTHSVNIDPSLSPDGRQMVFISVIAGKEQLFTMNLDGSDPRQLTHDDADHEDPSWSPDGKKIAFVLVAGTVERIYLMNVDGSHLEPLTPAGLRVIHPHWSPDSTKVIYCTDDDQVPGQKNDSEIYSIEIASGTNVKLIGGGINTYPSWSPDGKRIAFRKIIDNGNSEVFVANADGSGIRNLTNNPAFDGWPAWSPDGSEIAFASNRNSSYEIYVMNADGTDVRKVANSEGRATAPAWSPDGKTIYFPICQKVAFRADCQIFAAKLDAYAH